MRKLIVALVLALATGACTLPNAPSNAGYRCVTQLRLYTWPDGTAHWEQDFYWQREPCPVTPIP